MTVARTYADAPKIVRFNAIAREINREGGTRARVTNPVDGPRLEVDGNIPLEVDHAIRHARDTINPTRTGTDADIVLY